MDVSKSILTGLTCSQCENYLKRSPVYIKLDGAAVCGPCLDPKDKDKVVRNKQYELLAQMAKFPCKYIEFGCTKKVNFGGGDCHENVCSFKQFLCPVFDSGKCEWLGPRNQFLEHCEENHPENIIKNPVQLTHDIKKSSTNTYLVNAFVNVLFLLFTKVSVIDGKIYYCLRYFGQPGPPYTYSLKVKRNELEICKPGKIAAEGCLALQEDASLVLDTNSLIQILDGFDDTAFILSIKRPCKYQCKGCKYIDIPWKCIKHEKFFCDYSKKCLFCKSSQIGTGLLDHYRFNHHEFIHNTGSLWTPKGLAYKNENKVDCEVCFISSEAGTLICEWNSRASGSNWFFQLNIYAPPSYEYLINNYECSLVETISALAPKFQTASSILPDAVEDWSWSFLVEKGLVRKDSFKVAVRINRINF